MERLKTLDCPLAINEVSLMPFPNGVAIVEINTFKEIYSSNVREEFLERTFTAAERIELDNKGNIAERLAVRLAGKQAVQQLGSVNIGLDKIEILHRDSGEPYLTSGHSLVSLTHDGDYAAAFAVAKKPFSFNPTERGEMQIAEWISISNGIDLALIKRFERIYNSSEKRKSFLNRVFTQKEQEEIIKLPEEKRVQKIAKGFSIKEAISKALSTGISLASPSRAGVHWKDIEVLYGETENPHTTLYYEAEKRAQERGIHSFILSLTDDGEYALTFAVAIRPFSL